MIIAHIDGAHAEIGEGQGYQPLPVRFSKVNCTVNGPDTPCMTTAWTPTPDELKRLLEGASIHVTLIGVSHPPIMVSVGD